MTKKLKCAFCGAELRELKEAGTVVGLFCPNHCKTRVAMDEEIWQALIAGKKAQDALKGIEIRVAAIRGCVQDGYTQLGERNRNIFIALELFKDLIKEITSITKQEE